MYVSNAHPSRNITTSSAALVITAKTVTPTLSHQIGAPPVSFSSSRWYIGPTSLHLTSLCTCRIVQLMVWLFQSTGCTLLSWLLFVIQFFLPQNWLQLREGGAVRLGTALESHFVLVLALVLLVLIVLLVLAAALYYTVGFLAIFQRQHVICLLLAATTIGKRNNNCLNKMLAI